MLAKRASPKRCGPVALLCSSVAALAAAAVGAILLGLGVGGREFGLLLGDSLAGAASTGAGRVVLVAAALVILACDIAVVLRALGFGASDAVEFESEAGLVSVDVTALEECLRRCALEDEIVTDASASVRIARGGLGQPVHCTVQVGLRERPDVPGRGKDLAAALKRRFLQVIPIDIDPVVDVRVFIREPESDALSAQETQEMPVSDLGPGAPEPLPDTPDFTGERRYGEDDDKSGRAKG